MKLGECGTSFSIFGKISPNRLIRVYDARRPVEPQYPAIKASKGEEYLFAESEDLVYAPPRSVQRHFHSHYSSSRLTLYSPCYVGLKNNVATRLMKTSLSPWPQGTEDYVNHSIVKAYIQTVAKVSEVDKLTQYGSRVVDVKKVGDKWHLKYSTRRRDSVSGVTSRLQKELVCFTRRLLIIWLTEIGIRLCGYCFRSLPCAQSTRHTWFERVESSLAFQSLA